MKIIVSHATGNANVRAIINGLKQANMLEKFYTCIAYFNGSTMLKAHPKEAARRRFDEILQKDTTTYPWKETARLLSIRLGLSFLTSKESSLFSIDRVNTGLDKFLSKQIDNYKTINGVYAYEDGSYHTFSSAKKRNITTIYDLPIAYWETAKRLLKEESERLPAWKKTIDAGINDSAEKLQRKTKELELADIVVVPSDFVYKSLPGWALQKKIIISPFGTPAIAQERLLNKTNSKPLRVLFAGSMSQRKGLADLFEAIKLLDTDSVELVVLGSLMDNFRFYKKELSKFTYEATRPHAEVLKLMESCDIFCLPSIVEGRALVIQEAMSRQLPIIITENTGGSDLVVDELTGFLVPIRSPEKIAEKINWFLENRGKIPEMGKHAKEHAEKYTWQKYSSTVIEAILHYCEEIKV